VMIGAMVCQEVTLGHRLDRYPVGARILHICHKKSHSISK
jgi:hypothetical protein